MLRGLIKRVVGYHAPNNVAFNLYKLLTRSIVGNSAPVWSPQNTKELIKLESIQRGMTRFATILDGRSCQDRCLHDKIKIPIENYTKFIDTNTSRRSGGCGLLLKPLLTKTETFIQSFFSWKCK